MRVWMWEQIIGDLVFRFGVLLFILVSVLMATWTPSGFWHRLTGQPTPESTVPSSYDYFHQNQLYPSPEDVARLEAQMRANWEM